jgi:hypothetical protein
VLLLPGLLAAFLMQTPGLLVLLVRVLLQA